MRAQVDTALRARGQKQQTSLAPEYTPAYLVPGIYVRKRDNATKTKTKTESKNQEKKTICQLSFNFIFFLAFELQVPS